MIESSLFQSLDAVAVGFSYYCVRYSKRIGTYEGCHIGDLTLGHQEKSWRVLDPGAAPTLEDCSVLNCHEQHEQDWRLFLPNLT